MIDIKIDNKELEELLNQYSVKIGKSQAEIIEYAITLMLSFEDDNDTASEDDFTKSMEEVFENS